MNGSRQQTVGSADEATQGGEAQRDFAWAEASVWTERMLSALGNGVKGGKWFSLMDKVFAPKTLAAAWTKVRANKGAAGVDGQSIERFAAKAEVYLAELSAALRELCRRQTSLQRNRYGCPTSLCGVRLSETSHFDLLMRGALIRCIRPGMMPTLISASR